MKKTILKIICLAACLALFSIPLSAKEKYTVTVLPFTVHSADNIDYVRQGIADMLISRITVADKIEVTRKDIVQEAMKKAGVNELSPAGAQNIGLLLKSDYVVWGSITKFGNSISIDGKLTNTAGGKSDVAISSQSKSLDDVIPQINDFSSRIVQHIIGTVPQAVLSPSVVVSPVVSASPAPPAPPTGASREAQIIASMKAAGKKGTLTSMINPEFINSHDPLDRKKGFWMSQEFKTEFIGMDVGDVNNDGLNEVVAIDAHNVFIYQKVDQNLKLIKTIAGKSYHKYIAVDVADINKDQTPEIIVTSLNNKVLNSFVIQYQDGDYKVIDSDIRYFLRVIDTPSGAPLLLGQPYGMDKVFQSQIYEIIYKNGKYVSSDKLKIPQGISIYGLAIDTLGASGSEKIFALDELDYLMIMEKNNKPLWRILSFGFSPTELIWRSDTQYGGSNNYLDNYDKQKSTSGQADQPEGAFANLRILMFDTNKDGKKEMIIVKNLSSVGRIFKKLKLFTSSEIYNLEWDGLGMAENWRTNKINGYIADYCFKDVDNDGKPEIVLALVKSVGAAIVERSVIVVYELEMPE